MTSDHKPQPENVPGPFYVEVGCCTACGVPQSIAPELFGEDAEQYCFVKRQPHTTAETDSMLRVVATQELGCIRYRGTDQATLRRLVEAGEGAQCDASPPPGVTEVRRDHVTFVVRDPGAAWTGRTILQRLLSHLAGHPYLQYKTTPISEDAVRGVTSVSVSWFQDEFHRLETSVSPQPGRYVLRHFGPPRFSDTLNDWLAIDDAFDDVRWQTETEWAAGGSWQRTPW